MSLELPARASSTTSSQTIVVNGGVTRASPVLQDVALSFDIAAYDRPLVLASGSDYSHHFDWQAGILKSLDSKSASLDKWYEATISRAETLSFVESKIEAAGLGIGYGGSKLALGFGRFLTSPFYTSAESYDALFKSNQVPVRVLAKNYSQLSAERKIGGFTSLATQLVGGAVVGRAGGAGISGIKNRFLGAPSYASGTPRRPVGAFAAERGAPTIGQLRLEGNAFRDELAGALRAEGRGVETEVYKPTLFGKRYMDIEVRDVPDGKILGGIETKLGDSRYTASQRAKDTYLKIWEKYPVQVVREPRK